MNWIILAGATGVYFFKLKKKTRKNPILNDKVFHKNYKRSCNVDFIVSNTYPVYMDYVREVAGGYLKQQCVFDGIKFLAARSLRTASFGGWGNCIANRGP
jgi:hypothetical protein